MGQTCVPQEMELTADNLNLQVNNLKQPTADLFVFLEPHSARGKELSVKPTKNKYQLLRSPGTSSRHPSGLGNARKQQTLVPTTKF